ncbi:MAG: DNA-binding protein [Methanothrix sp.]|nr:DNA-binding protein [Methanothrix sp.]
MHFREMLTNNFGQGRCLLARLDHGADILHQAGRLAKEEGIKTGILTAIGALSLAELAYYDQASLEYRKIPVEGPVELLSCLGNISIRDEQPFVHAHAVLADSQGRVLGGHLITGTVFAAELCLQEFLGEPFKREYDSVTGLHLWGKNDNL